MLSSTFRRAAFSAARPLVMRSLATGPSTGGAISDELLQKLGSLSTQALVDGLWVMGWPSAQIDGARPLAKGMKCVGRAVTLRFVPARPDIAQDKPPGGESPEYEAFEKCGPKEVRSTTKYSLTQSLTFPFSSSSWCSSFRFWSCPVSDLGRV
jgi:hypothetical protein